MNGGCRGSFGFFSTLATAQYTNHSVADVVAVTNPGGGSPGPDFAWSGSSLYSLGPRGMTGNERSRGGRTGRRRASRTLGRSGARSTTPAPLVPIHAAELQ